MKKLLVLFALGIFLLGCIGPEPEPEQPTAYYGDTVTVDYILYIDDEIVDTSVESVAREKGVYVPLRDYVPLTFKLVLGEENMFIPGFVKGIVGMKVNESKIFLILPGDDGYGYYDPMKTYNVSRYYEMNATEVMPMSYFKERNMTVEIGDAFNTDIGKVFVDNITNDSVLIVYFFQQGHTFTYNGLPNTVVSGMSKNETYMIMFDVVEDETYFTTSLVSGNRVAARVTKLTNDTITFDENHPLAGEILEYNVTLLDLVKAPAE